MDATSMRCTPKTRNQVNHTRNIHGWVSERNTELDHATEGWGEWRGEWMRKVTKTWETEMVWRSGSVRPHQRAFVATRDQSANNCQSRAQLQPLSSKGLNWHQPSHVNHKSGNWKALKQRHVGAGSILKDFLLPPSNLSSLPPNLSSLPPFLWRLATARSSEPPGGLDTCCLVLDTCVDACVDTRETLLDAKIVWHGLRSVGGATVRLNWCQDRDPACDFQATWQNLWQQVMPSIYTERERQKET